MSSSGDVLAIFAGPALWQGRLSRSSSRYVTKREKLCADNHEVVAAISPRLPYSATLGVRDVCENPEGVRAAGA